MSIHSAVGQTIGLPTSRPKHLFRSGTFRRGASTYALKQSGAEEFKRAIRSAIEGRSYLSELIARETVDYLLNRWPQGGIKKSLRPRQAEILKLLVEGNSMKRVADILDISPGTVAFHKYNMMRELRINSNAEFLQYAMRNHMISARPDMRLQLAAAGQD